MNYSSYCKTMCNCLEHTEYSYNIGTEVKTIEAETAFSKIVEIFLVAKKENKQLFFIGNGGSAAIAGHMTADFMKNGRMHTISLNDPALLTCMGNDYGYEFIFSRPLDFLGKKADILVTISSSGNSPNIINAIHAARERQMKIITLSGFLRNNKSRQLGDYNIYVPISHYGIVESIHHFLLQQFVDGIAGRDEEV